MRHLLKCNYYKFVFNQVKDKNYTAKNQTCIINAGFKIAPPKVTYLINKN